MTTQAEYVLEAFREGADSTLYRGPQRGSSTPALAVAIGYSLAAELEAGWAVKPLALARHEGQTVIVLKDPGGEPWILFLSWTRGIHSI
jgi:hypothetical protein